MIQSTDNNRKFIYIDNNPHYTCDFFISKEPKLSIKVNILLLFFVIS